MSKTILINVSAGGEVSIDAQGYRGASCEKATEQIELMLGGEAKRTKKPEYFMPASNQQGTKLVF